MKRLGVGIVSLAILLPTGAAYADRYDGRDDCGGYSYDHRCRNEDYDNGRDDNRRAGISPGPFDRSPVDIHDNNLTVCFPFSQCKDKEPTDPGSAPPKRQSY